MPVVDEEEEVEDDEEEDAELEFCVSSAFKPAWITNPTRNNNQK
jgi:hypothetical protein